MAFACCIAAPAFSQSNIVHERMRPGQDNSVQSSISTTVPLADNTDSIAEQENVLRSFYKMAEGSCVVVLETVADSCEISRITTNTRVDDSNSRGSRLTLSGQISMKVTFKSRISQPAE
jgi:hypothetical protein